MSTLTLRIQRPFKQTELTIEWVSIEGPNGGFVVGPGHRSLISAVSGSSSVTYKSGGSEQSIEVGEADGLVHVIDNIVILFLG